MPFSSITNHSVPCGFPEASGNPRIFLSPDSRPVFRGSARTAFRAAADLQPHAAANRNASAGMKQASPFDENAPSR